jgi:peptide/nickel transport system permease protein
MTTDTALGVLERRERKRPGIPLRLGAMVWRLARRKPLGFLGLLFLVAMVLVAVAPRLVAPHSPSQTNVAPRFQSYCLGPQGSALCPSRREASPLTGQVRTFNGSLSEPFGTDQLGRDIFSRVLWGTRVSAYVGFGAVLVNSLVAVGIGVTCGYFGGRYDAILQRFVDAVMALPSLVVLLALPMMIGGPTFTKLILILGILGGVGGSRVIRAAVIGVRSAPYLEAARVIGARDGRIMAWHVLPNIFGPWMVQATIALGGIILTESSLSFLGFGVTNPNQPSWGAMLQLGQTVAAEHPMQAVWPGLAIALAVFSFNMLGDALRDLLDPRLRGASGSFH